jgi:ComF family protein
VTGRQLLRGVADAVLAALLAPPCAVCARVLDAPLAGAVCDACWARVPSRGFAPLRTGRVSVVESIGDYDGTLRDIIHALKYAGRRSIAPRLAARMIAHAPRALDGADCVVPVPLHRRRLRERGFNQADDLARAFELPRAAVLVRARATTPQVDLPADERRLNVRDAFAVSPRPSRSITDRVVVLVDDVVTTGATLDACAGVLLAAGAREVRAVTAARVASGLR